MLDLPFEDVRNRLDPPVGVPREPREVVGRVVRPEGIEEKKRVEAMKKLLQSVETEGSGSF